MIEEIAKCNKCNLCNNQKPLLDNCDKCDIMWIGLSAKQVEDVSINIPLDKNTNSGYIIDLIEKELPNLTFYKTNLVKCLPLDNNCKLRYPTKDEMNNCIYNIINEINFLKPKKIFVLGRKTYNYIYNYINKNNLNINNIIYIKHPSYIYIYKRKYIKDYVKEVVDLCNEVD